MLLLFAVFHLIVIALLSRWSFRRTGLIPVIGLVIVGLRYHSRQEYIDTPVRTQLLAQFQTYGLTIARSVMIFGIRQLGRIFGLIGYESAFRLLGGHLAALIVGLFLKKRDLTLVAHRGWWVSGLLLFIQGYEYGGRSLVIDLIAMWIGLTMAVYAFVVFVLGALDIKSPRQYSAFLFFFFQLTILLYVMYRFDTFTVWTVLGGQIYLGIIYMMMYRVGAESTPERPEWEDDSEDLLHVILRGERVKEHTERLTLLGSSSFLSQLHESIGPKFRALPKRAFEMIGGLNIVFMILQLVMVFRTDAMLTGGWLQIAFRTSIAVYVVNYLTLQKQRISVIGQRILAFLLINFGIYLTMYTLTDGDPLMIVGFGVIWTLLNGIAMIHTRGANDPLGLSAQDRWYWLIGNIFSILINSYFIFLLPVSLQLRFTVVMIYLAGQSIMLRYQLSEETMKR